MIFFPIIELIDRLVIAEIKFAKTNANQAELDWYRDQTKNLNMHLIQSHMTELKEIHNAIWGLESQLKSGKENELSLEEIGKRAIEIRNWNNRRISLKNQMAEILGCPVKEIKQDHLSQ